MEIILSKNLIDSLIMKYKTNNFNNVLEDYELDNPTEIEKMKLIEITKNGLWIYDYSSPKKEQFDHYIEKKRSTLSCFIHKDMVLKISEILSKKNILIGIYDHTKEKSYFYKKNKFVKWTNNFDFITSYHLKYDKYGNPKINPVEHIWGCGTDIDILKNTITDFDDFYQNYVEMTLINKYFQDGESLIKLCHDASLELKNSIKIVSNF